MSYTREIADMIKSISTNAEIINVRIQQSVTFENCYDCYIKCLELKYMIKYFREACHVNESTILNIHLKILNIHLTTKHNLNFWDEQNIFDGYYINSLKESLESMLKSIYPAFVNYINRKYNDNNPIHPLKENVYNAIIEKIREENIQTNNVVFFDHKNSAIRESNRLLQICKNAQTVEIFEIHINKDCVDVYEETY